MATFRIRYKKWIRRQDLIDAEGPFFDIYAKEEEHLIPTVSLGVTCAVVDTYGCDNGRIAPTRCAIIAAGLDGR